MKKQSQQEQSKTLHSVAVSINPVQATSDVCSHAEDGQCITCSDQAVLVKVWRVNDEAGLALVVAGDETEEIDISLVDEVAPGDTLLAHGGVAIAHLDK